MEGSGEVSTVSAGTTAQATNSTYVEGTIDIDFEEPSIEAPESATDSIESTLVLNNQNFDEFVSAPETAHDKLVKLSQLDEGEEKSKEDLSKEDLVNKESLNEKEPSVEQKIMLLQAEALKLLAGSRGSEKEKDELMKKLKKLMEEMESDPKKTSKGLLSAVLSLFLILSKAGEKGAEQLSKEMKAQN